MGFSGASPAEAVYNPLDSLSGVVPSYGAFPRVLTSGSAAILTSQTMLAVHVPVPAGRLVRNAGFVTGSQAAVTPSNWWMAVLNQALQVLAVTADQLTAPIGAFVKMQLPFNTPFYVPNTSQGLGWLYVCIMVNAVTVPNFECISSSGLPSTAPAIIGNSNAGMTSPPAVGQQMSALAGGVNNLPTIWVN